MHGEHDAAGEAQGSADAQKQVTDLANCNQSHGCQDATCLQTNCQSQLDACVGGSAPPPAGTPSSGNAPPGNVPSDLVGKWTAGKSANLMDEQELVFNADGTGEYDDVYSGNISGCTGNLVAKYKGNVVIDTGAGTITVYATDVTETTAACGKSSTKSDPAQTLSFTYTDAPNASSTAIMITDQKCAAKYPDDRASANLYCRYTYYKQ